MTNPEQLTLNFDRVPVAQPPRARLNTEAEPVRESENVELASHSAVVVTPKPSVAVEINEPPNPGVPIDPEGFVLRPPLDKYGKFLPIPYDLKVSARARQLYLRVEPGRGLQVTVPKRYPRRTIPSFVESQRKWITEALLDLDQQTPVMYRQWPPSQLDLKACETLVDIRYKTRESSSSKATARWLSPSVLALDVDYKNRSLVAKVIAKALKARATDLLGPWLDGCSIRSQLRFKRMVIRGQRTVWGSYSSSGTLSLNYKLLFLRPEIVDYVLLHELAHIKHLDHSAAFWRFLEELKPGASELDDELQEAGRLVPPWLELVSA